MPATPTPPDGSIAWVDVTNWQTFLKTHGEAKYLGPSYPTDMFDQNTETATQDWQNKNHLPPTGIVNTATYTLAVAQGLADYPTINL
jgi:peptidoglycan hydrolase-like protein with peptidoglycan-binding domain